MREQAIKDLKEFHKQLTKITDDDIKNDIFHLSRGLVESYELFDCEGIWMQQTFATIYVRTKKTKRLFTFGTCIENPPVFEELMEELERGAGKTLDDIRIQTIEEMGFKVKREKNGWDIFNPEATPKTDLSKKVASIFDSGYSLDTAYRNFDELDKQRKERLFKILVDWSDELFKRNRKEWE